MSDVDLRRNLRKESAVKKRIYQGYGLGGGGGESRRKVKIQWGQKEVKKKKTEEEPEHFAGWSVTGLRR